MKAKILMLAMTAMLVASCSQNDVTLTVPETDRAIGFKVYTGVQTKGTVMDTPELKKKSEGFGIFAVLTGSGGYSSDKKGLYMDNVHATYKSEDPAAWIYSPLKYWPTNTDKVSFFAYAPYNAEGVAFTAVDKDVPTLEFTLPESQKDMPDLVVAAVVTTDPGSNANAITQDRNKDKVSFNLKHVLSRVGMKAKTNADLTGNGQTKVYITGVKLTQTKASEAYYLYSKATFNMATSKWDYTSAEALGTESESTKTYELKSASATDKGVLNLVAANFAGYKDASIDITTDAAGVSLFPQNEYLFFIPMEGEGTTSEKAVKAEITYDIVTKAYDGATTATTSTMTSSVDLGTGGFKQGTAYMYTFKVGLTGIEVDASVDGWGEETTGSDIDVPTPAVSTEP